MRLRLVIVLVMLPFMATAQTLPERPFRDGKLVSKAGPPVTLEPGKAFHYAGGQVIDIFKVAGAEQHFFVEVAPDSAIRRFYWVQFEHYYPDNSHQYDFTGIKQQPVRLGLLDFMGDVTVAPGYFTSGNRAGSDSEAGAQFLRARGYKLDGTFVRLRLFHLPDSSRRKELMIIYGETLPSGVSEEALKSVIIQRAQENLKVQLAL